jgi:E3 ubiquitin-protein ligase AMFR
VQFACSLGATILQEFFFLGKYLDCKHCCFSNMVHMFVSGSISECRGFLVRHCGFLLDIAAFLTGLGHYLTICYLRGMSFHLVDAFLIMNMRVSRRKIFQLLFLLYSIQTLIFSPSPQRILYLAFHIYQALVFAIFKRIKAYVKLCRALSSLDGSLSDASYEEISAFNDECAICRVIISLLFICLRFIWFHKSHSNSLDSKCNSFFMLKGPMSRAKKLPCSHLFHLACLRSWYG